MGGERRSLQDRIRERQASGFVGRQGQVIQYQENFDIAPDDERRRFLFNIHGNAGVGKTFLSRQLRHIAASTGALTGYADETAEDVTSAMTALAADFGRGGNKLGDFEKRVSEYRQRRHELESDPHAPAGVSAFLTKTAVTIGLAAARDVPFAGSLLAPVDAAAVADQANQTREYIARKLSDHRDMRLLLSPADELTPVWVAGLNRAAAGRAVALFFDTYERTGPVLDSWLRALYAGRYGELPETLITTISGQSPLDPNRWGEYLPVIADIPLEPFSEAEARQFLASKGIADEPAIQVILTLSGRLPLWLATLADARRQGATDIGDPSGSAVERFLKWEEDPARREIAVAAALPRMLNQDVLAVMTALDQARELFGWLRGLPFVSQRAESWVYHDVVRAAMLRLRRAEAPAEWRSTQNLLARANDRWASEAAGGTDDTWANADWVRYTRESEYHLLCADPYGSLPDVLASAVMAAERGLVRARQWAALITDAGRDTNINQLKEWGRRLTDCVRSDDRDGLASYLTCLIDDAALDRTTRALAHEARGEAHTRRGHYDDALADFNRAIELEPDRAWAIARRGEAYRQMGRHADALADFNRILHLDLDLDPAWTIATRGQTYLAMGRHDDALADFDHAVELDPLRDWIIADRGRIHLALGHYENALADFTRAIKLDPKDDFTITNRGQTYEELERYDDALADYNRAIELDPENDWNIANRGHAYHALERYDDALADYNHAIELNPANEEAITHRGRTYAALQRYDEALADYNRAIELNPTYDVAIASRGQTYHALQRYDDALADYNHALELNPANVEAIANRGQTYDALQRYDDALTDYDRAIELDPTWDEAIAARGKTYQAMKRYDDALADYNRAIELDPDNDDYGARRAEIHLRLMGED